jgi:hypothetical protein
VTHRAVMQGRIRNIIRMREAGLLVPWRGPVMDRVDAARREPLKKIFDRHGKRLAAIHARFREELDAEFDSLREEISAVLTPEERRELEKEISRWPPPPPSDRPPGDISPGPGPRSGPFGPEARPDAPARDRPERKGFDNRMGPGDPKDKAAPRPGAPEEKRGPGNDPRLDGVK